MNDLRRFKPHHIIKDNLLSILSYKMSFLESFKNTVVNSTSPVVSSTYILFKISPIIIYLLAYNFASFTNITILLIIIKSMEFYAVQNIFGRKLVGLRWSYDKDFKYETFKQYGLEEFGNSLDKIIFWYGMYLTILLWLVFSITTLFGFKFIYFFIVLYCLFLEVYQYYGFRGSYYHKDETNNENGQGVNIMDVLSRYNNLTSFFQTSSS